MGVSVSYDQINDGFLDPDKKTPLFSQDYQEKCTFFDNFCEKVWKFKNNAYLCNPNQQKRWW